MPTGLKQELGLGDPKPSGSTEQADKFKAAYQAAAAKINECLQYTAAYAQKTKHDPQAAKRDTTCQAYQVALARIDPTNPAVAQGAIDQVLAGVETLKSVVEGLKTAAEKAYTAWTGRQGDLEGITDKIREMVEWGHDKAGALQKIIDAVVAKANERAYEEATTALEQLLGKANPIYQDYQKQKTAQEEYTPARQDLDAKLAETKNCPFKSLATDQQALEAGLPPMEQAATAKNYVDALPKLRDLETKVTALKTKVTELEAKKKEYETARATLDSKLAEASKCQFKSLAEMDQQIADLTAKTDAAAADEKYDEALTSVGELTTKVDEKIQKAKELEEKKQQYEQSRQALDPKLTEASQCQFKSLAELDQKISDLTTKTDTAATDEKYDEAVTCVGELTKAVDEKLQKTKDLEEKKKQYEDSRKALDPKLTQASTCQHAELAELDQKIADLTTKTDTAATDEKYDEALTHLGELTTAVDEKIAKTSEIDAYKEARKAVDPKIQQAAYCSKHESLGPIEKEIESLKAQLDKAVAAKDFKTATTLCGQLSSKIDTKLSEQGRLDRNIVGSAQKERADKKLESLDEATRKRFNDLSTNAKSAEERDYLSKALASNYSIDEIEAFAKKISGKDKEWLQNNLKLTGSTDGKGVMQQWSYSCNATTTQAIRGELDPIYALKLHEENKDITTADDADATKVNPKLAEEQKKWLESEYKGKASDPHKGVATSRDDPEGKGSGRWADDLMNNMSDVTGVEYANKKIGAKYKTSDAVADIEAGLKKGHPVPIVVGSAPDDYAHYVLVTGRSDGPPPTLTIHDVGSGKTITRTVQDVKDGKLGIGTYNQISALDNPSTKEDKKKKK